MVIPPIFCIFIVSFAGKYVKKNEGSKKGTKKGTPPSLHNLQKVKSHITYKRPFTKHTTVVSRKGVALII